MALSIFSSAVVSLETRTELQINSARATLVKQYRTELLVACKKDEFASFVEQFSSNLLAELQCLLSIPKPATVPRIKDRIWRNYAIARAKRLPLIWSNFLGKIQCKHFTNEPLLMELINKSIFKCPRT